MKAWISVHSRTNVYRVGPVGGDALNPAAQPIDGWKRRSGMASGWLTVDHEAGTTPHAQWTMLMATVAVAAAVLPAGLFSSPA